MLDLSPYESDIASFRRFLRFENKSDRTVSIYTGAAGKFATWLADTTDCAGWQDVESRDLQDFTISVLQERTAGYASNLFRALQQFFKWWSAEEDQPNVMLGMKPPFVPDKPVPVLRVDKMKALLKTCEGKDFIARRDTAILYLFMDSGLRRGELAALKLDDVDLDERVAYVLGKGRRPRAVPFGHRAALALDRYLKARRTHKAAYGEWLWLSGRTHGRIYDNGIYQMIQRRGEQVGIPELHPHMLRHSWAHHYRAGGGNPDDLKRLAGWRSDAMLARYGASLADERARTAARKHSLGDRI